MSDLHTTGPFDVRATYADMDAARRGLEVLEKVGIDAADITLSGPAAADADVARSTAGKDAAIMDKGFKASVAGAVAGTVIGAVVGLVVGAVAFGSLTSVGAITMAIGLAVAGGGVGLAVNSIRTMREGEAWEGTLEEHGPGPHVVGAHVDSEEAARKAREALTGTSPTELVSLDRDGNPLESTS